MRKIFVTTFVALSMLSSFGGVTAASAAMVTTATCDRNPGDFLGVDGQCHTADERGKVAPAGTNVVNQVANNSGGVDKQFNDFDAFLADCKAHGGHVYSAEDWNKRGIQPHLNPGQMQCYRDPSWK